MRSQADFQSQAETLVEITEARHDVLIDLVYATPVAAQRNRMILLGVTLFPQRLSR